MIDSSKSVSGSSRPFGMWKTVTSVFLSILNILWTEQMNRSADSAMKVVGFIGMADYVALTVRF